MKRELICVDCNNESQQRLYELASKYGEPFDAKLGVLRLPDIFVCDECNKPIIIGDIVVCRSFGQVGEVLNLKWVNKYIRDLTPDEAFEFAKKVNGF